MWAHVVWVCYHSWQRESYVNSRSLCLCLCMSPSLTLSPSRNSGVRDGEGAGPSPVLYVYMEHTHRYWEVLGGWCFSVWMPGSQPIAFSGHMVWGSNSGFCICLACTQSLVPSLDSSFYFIWVEGGVFLEQCLGSTRVTSLDLWSAGSEGSRKALRIQCCSGPGSGDHLDAAQGSLALHLAKLQGLCSCGCRNQHPLLTPQLFQMPFPHLAPAT